jgi:hypothetical protein
MMTVLFDISAAKLRAGLDGGDPPPVCVRGQSLRFSDARAVERKQKTIAEIKLLDRRLRSLRVQTVTERVRPANLKTINSQRNPATQ